MSAPIAASSGWIATPFDVPLVGIPIPTVLLMFEHVNFNKADAAHVLVVVPENSPLESLVHVDTTLETLRGVLKSLPKLGDYVGFLSFVTALDLASVQHLATKVSSTVEDRLVLFRKSTQIGDLFMHRFKDGWVVFGVPVTEISAEDIFSSIILVGMPTTAVQFFNNRDFLDTEGHLRVEVRGTDSLPPDPTGTTISLQRVAALVPDLHTAKPDSDPPGQCDTLVAPTGNNGAKWGRPKITIFGDEISGYRFE